MHYLYTCQYVLYLYSLTFISNNNSKRTEVLYGSENVLNTLSQFVSKSKTINSCGDYRAPSLVVEVEEYRKLLAELKKRYQTKVYYRYH